MKNMIAFLFALLLASPSYANTLGNGIATVQTSVAASSLIAKASPGVLNGFSATSGAVAGYILIFDSATVPSNGTVTPKFCYSLPALSTTGATWNAYAATFSNGVTIVFSSTGCFTQTLSATAFISAQPQ